MAEQKLGTAVVTAPVAPSSALKMLHTLALLLDPPAAHHLPLHTSHLLLARPPLYLQFPYCSHDPDPVTLHKPHSYTPFTILSIHRANTPYYTNSTSQGPCHPPVSPWSPTGTRRSLKSKQKCQNLIQHQKMTMLAQPLATFLRTGEGGDRTAWGSSALWWKTPYLLS